MTVLLAVGRIANAWSFVWPAYVITWVGLALYVTSLVVRSRRARRTEQTKKDLP